MDKAKFFASVRASLFGGSLNNTEVAGCEAIINAFEAAGLKNDRWLAYMLATAFHETDKKMQPIEEYGKGHGRKYGVPKPPFNKIYYGRGFVQLTWDYNYTKAGKELNVPLLEKPELALQPDVAADIMIKGMTEGWFTGKKLSDYFSPTKTDWVNARRIINGVDRAEDIAGYGKKFLQAIEAAG